MDRLSGCKTLRQILEFVGEKQGAAPSASREAASAWAMR